MTLGRLWRTAAHLQPSQIAWRLLHEARLRVDARRPPDTRWNEAPARFALQGTPPHEARPTALWRDGFVEYQAVRGDRGDWRAAGKPKLWRYHRHYHDELVWLAAAAQEADARELVAGWLAACPPPRGDAWEPYPVARRILNWSVAGCLLPALQPLLAPGIAAKVRFLGRRLERHLLGNHLICDAAALVAGSAAVGLDFAPAARLLASELQRQVLPDGGYAERTAQYHAIVLRDVQLALWFARGALPPEVAQAAQKMEQWLAQLSRIPLLNDAAPDAVPIATGAGGDVELPDTGWSFAREGRHELLFEHGPIGPAEQPGHGHSDALSFELFWDGAPVVTDTGVSTYEPGPVRDFERSARAHACVTVGGEGPDELWAAFRVGARGRVQGGLTRRDGPVRVFDGTVAAPQGWTHRRRLVFWPGEALVVLDEVAGARGVIESHLPLAGPLQLDLSVLRGARRDGEGWVSEGFGKRHPRPAITFTADATGRVAYALLARGRTAALEGASCILRGPNGAISVK